MSVAASSIGEGAIAGQTGAAASNTKPPKRRMVTAKADAVAQPEAR